MEKTKEMYIKKQLEDNKEYFDHILDKIDSEICLDEEQRKAILINDRHCLLIAGAGARENYNYGSKSKIFS